MTDALDILLNFACALAAGLLIGAERGWQERNTEDSRLVAGIRTYGLAALLGGFAAFLAERYGVLLWVVVFIGFALLVLASYLIEQRERIDIGLTSEIALLVTFLLGSLSLSGHAQLAAAGAVAVALLLSLKSVLHGALRKLSELELSSILKLLFISVVMLPALPNQGFGPWGVFNPYVIWWMVVLIAGIGFSAYVAIRLIGTRYGLLLTALLGGIVSSTAMTMTLSRLDEPRLRSMLACGLLAASALMFPRVLLEVALVNRDLFAALLWPLLVSTVVYAIGAIFFYRMAGREPDEATEPPLKNPFELGPALRFAILLTLILFLVEAGRRAFGDAGVYLVSLISGFADVDAITLSLARTAQTDLASDVAIRGIFIAVLANSLAKAGLILFIAGRSLALRTVPVMLAGLLAGAAVLWLA